jgi:hypothetical protein
MTFIHIILPFDEIVVAYPLLYHTQLLAMSAFVLLCACLFFELMLYVLVLVA